MMTTTVRLRTMAPLSAFNFGVYEYRTVEEILDKIKDPAYLVWVYYNIPHITFSGAILDRLLVTKRIAKPGTDVEFWKAKKEHFRESLEMSDVAKEYRNDYNGTMKLMNQTRVAHRRMHEQSYPHSGKSRPGMGY